MSSINGVTPFTGSFKGSSVSANRKYDRDVEQIKNSLKTTLPLIGVGAAGYTLAYKAVTKPKATAKIIDALGSGAKWLKLDKLPKLFRLDKLAEKMKLKQLPEFLKGTIDKFTALPKQTKIAVGLIVGLGYMITSAITRNCYYNQGKIDQKHGY